MLIHTKDGTSRYGLKVGLTGSVMRVAVADCEDVSEFKLVNGSWISSDRCEVVSFEFQNLGFSLLTTRLSVTC